MSKSVIKFLDVFFRSVSVVLAVLVLLEPLASSLAPLIFVLDKEDVGIGIQRREPIGILLAHFFKARLGGVEVPVGRLRREFVEEELGLFTLW